ncbi:phytanoyl-CoA dioxygenase family protein [Nonomuraea antri]|uniref:phytanoyl-CoA dioxygenase family protein n=1 Tax=Nonomuraea antri TaxID=2730852 RepID=UPI001C2B9411|nr:phytanoyl-CoA dioxygenase family protein [Nonomuraea antri]
MTSHRLSAEQRARFDEDGFVVVPGVLSRDEVNTLREVAESPAVRKSRHDQGGTERTVHDYDIACSEPVLWDFATHPGVLDAVESIIGEHIQLHHSKLAATPSEAGKGGVRWHQDLAFLPHSNTALVAAFLYLDDTTVDNGCMRIVRGSHKAGLLDHTDGAGTFLASCQTPEMWADESRVVPVEVPAGGISIHHCLALHSSAPNPSGRPRRGLIFQYRAADAVQLGGVVFRDTGRQVRGSFPARARCEAATFIMPFNVWPGETVPGYGSYDRLVGAEVLARGYTPQRHG